MERDVRLLTTVKDAVFQLVLDSGIDPSEFQWKTARVEDGTEYGVYEYRMSILEHSSGYFYRFGAYTDTFSPGESSRIAIEDVSYIREKWNQRLNIVGNWLAFLKRELEAPDLWAAILQEKRLLRITFESRIPNTQFTTDEKQYIARQLDEIRRQLITSHRLQSEQAESIEQGFNYIVESMNRFGKKDWLILAIGSLVSIAATSTLSPEITSDMFHRFTRAVGPLFDAFLRLIS
jgi:hypothetical protein